MLYIVTMYRWGDRDNHSYVIGVFDDHHTAMGAGFLEERWRGGKYKAEILGFPLNKYEYDYEPEVIKTSLVDPLDPDIASKGNTP
jgi:hypothetical protein